MLMRLKSWTGYKIAFWSWSHVWHLRQQTTEISKYIPRLTEDDVTFLEHEIDAINAQLDSLKYLIIPGGNILSSRAHVCRTVCRRAERNLVRMGREYEVDDVLRRFVNRLSDYFFMLSRYFMKKANIAEKPWKPAK